MVSEKQIRANRRNWKRWRGVSPEGRERQRQACRRNRPWDKSTGPRSDAGKRRARCNALCFGDSAAALEPYASANRLRDAVRELEKADGLPNANQPLEPTGKTQSDAEANLLEHLERFGSAIRVPVPEGCSLERALWRMAMQAPNPDSRAVLFGPYVHYIAIADVPRQLERRSFRLLRMLFDKPNATSREKLRSIHMMELLNCEIDRRLLSSLREAHWLLAEIAVWRAEHGLCREGWDDWTGGDF